MPYIPASPRPTTARLVPFVLLAALAACSGDGTSPPGPPSGLTISAGNNQEGTVGAAVLVAPAARVTDANGIGVPGISIQFDVTSGGGSVTGDSVVTNGDGVATVGSWRLGPTPGANQLRAQALGYSYSTSFTATAKPGAPSSLQVVTGGASLAAVVGQQVLPNPSVRVRDAFGNPIPGVLITWQVVQGGGTIIGPTQTTTDAEGRTTVGGWTMGANQGTNQLQASTANGLHTTFTALGIGIPSAMEAVSPPTQTGYASFLVPRTARVRVLGDNAVPVIGIPVVFTQVAGGGTISGDTIVTDGDGIAALGDWRLGADGSSTVVASVSGFGGQVTFTATGNPKPFTIDLRFLSSAPADVRDDFVAAALRWMEVITGDLPNQIVSFPVGSLGANCSAAPAMNETIDDVVIFASIVPIDGVGNILGQAGPCAQRTPSRLTLVGNMQFDVADAVNLSTNGQFKDVALHEMGHVLGFLESSFSALNLAQGLNGTDPYFTGAAALAAWPSLGITYSGNLIPLENGGGEQTRDSHWRESVLGDELMTGFITQGHVSPLSAITVGAMKDLGYSVDPSMADPFAPALRAAVPQGETTEIKERLFDAEVMVLPNGTVVRKP